MAALCMASIPALAAQTVTVSGPWARATVPGQVVTGAFMDIKSANNAKLVKVTTPAAGTTEIHTMKMNNGVMEMRQIHFVPLPANELVKLEPGSYHLMLFDLKQPLKAGMKVPLTLTIEQDDHTRINIQIQVEVVDQRGH